MRHKPLILFCLVVLTLVTAGALVACGSESTEVGAVSGQGDSTSPALADGPRTSIIVDNGGIYAIEDFEAAGYKKVTHFDLETLPGATDAWFGFFNQKDFELWFYPSHQLALDEGVEQAEFSIAKGAVPEQKRPPVRFFTYAVVGNVVMLCELEVATCESLIARLE